jgi:peptide/nickel transport system permease protein
MIRYILKRIAAMIPTLFGITLITFFIINLAPGDPVATQFGAGNEQNTDGGESQNQDRQSDAIKAKKELLGMLAEDKTVFAWRPVDSEQSTLQRLTWDHRFGSFDGWIHALLRWGDVWVAGGDDGLLQLLDDDGSLRSALEGHDVGVWALALSPDEQTLASADVEGNILLWRDGREVGRVEGDKKPVRDLVFIGDGSALLAASDNGFIRRIDTQTTEVMREYAGHTSGVYALALTTDGTHFWSGGYDRTLRYWSVDESDPIAEHAGHGQGINDIAVSGSRIATASDDRLVRVYETTGSEIGSPVELKGHYKQVGAVAFSADASRVFSGSSDETIRIWDANTGKALAQTPNKTGRVHTLVVHDGVLFSGSDSWSEVPVVIRYVKWLGRLATLDFGRSFVDEEPVIDKIAKALPITLYLNVIAIFLIYGISIPIGIYAAIYRGRAFDTVSSILLFVLYSIPNFWLATMLIMIFSSKRSFDWLPSVGLHSANAGDLSYLSWVGDWGMHLVLPMIVMVYAGFARLSRFVRTSMLETIQQDYVRTARAKGLSERIVVMKHAFRNSLIVIITLVGNLLPALIGGSVIVEFIFSINGMGKLGFDAILSRDYPTIMAITTFSAFLTLLGILVSDILYSVADPRVVNE